MRDVIKTICKDRKNRWLLVWPAALIMYISARLSVSLAEYLYARGIYRVYGTVVSFLTGLLPFSLAEVLLIMFPIFVLAVVVRGIIRIVRGRGVRIIRTADLIRLLLIIVGVILLWFMIGAGTNYYRYEYSHFSGLEIRKSSREELCELCRELAVKANEARVKAVEACRETDADGDSRAAYVSPYSDSELAYQAKLAMEKLGSTQDVLKGYYPKPKSVIFSRVMSEFNITGVYFPWTVEANVNVDVPDYSRGVTLCHELSHLRGFMREDEANYIGYLACVGSDCPELVYSGYMLALIHAGNKLYAESADMYFEQLYPLYSEGVRADMTAANEYWDQFKETVLSEVGEKMNDTYLKANNQTDGTKSYGRMVDLLLAERRAGLKE